VNTQNANPKKHRVNRETFTRLVRGAFNRNSILKPDSLLKASFYTMADATLFFDGTRAAKATQNSFIVHNASYRQREGI